MSYASQPALLRELLKSSSREDSVPADKQVKLFTMIYVLKQSETTSGKPNRATVLLGHKARGHGAGNYNGFGGKVEASDSSIMSSLARELKEESGLEIAEADFGERLQRKAVLWFQYPEQKTLMEVHVFVCPFDCCKGNITESEEMHPIVWNAIDELPLDKMWKDDPHWLPALLERTVRDWWSCSGTIEKAEPHEAIESGCTQKRPVAQGDGNEKPHSGWGMAGFFDFHEGFQDICWHTVDQSIDESKLDELVRPANSSL